MRHMLRGVTLTSICAKILVFACAFLASAASDVTRCTRVQARRADFAIGRFDGTLDRRRTSGDWNSFHELFVKFGHCDDGSMGEGFDEIVDELVCRRWQRIDKLFALDDRDFFEFVMRHVVTQLPSTDYRLRQAEPARLSTRPP